MQDVQRIDEMKYRKAVERLIDRENPTLQAEFVAAFREGAANIRPYLAATEDELVGTDTMPILAEPVDRALLKAGDSETVERVYATYGEIPAGLAVLGGTWAYAGLLNMEVATITRYAKTPADALELDDDDGATDVQGRNNRELRRLLYELGGVFYHQGWSSAKWSTLLGSTYWLETLLTGTEKVLEIPSREQTTIRTELYRRQASQPLLSALAMRPNIFGGPVGRACTAVALARWLQPQSPKPDGPTTLNALRRIARAMAPFDTEGMDPQKCLSQMQRALEGDNLRRQPTKTTETGGLPQSVQWYKAWDTGKTYDCGEEVQHQGMIYRAIQRTQGEPPQHCGEIWRRLRTPDNWT